MTDSTFGKLNAQVRKGSGKGVSRKLRADGKLPAVMYGKGKDNLLLTVDARDLRHALDPERKLNTFFSVTVRGEQGESVEQCVIADYQRVRIVLLRRNRTCLNFEPARRDR